VPVPPSDLIDPTGKKTAAVSSLSDDRKPVAADNDQEMVAKTQKRDGLLPR